MSVWGSYGTNRKHLFIQEQPCPFTGAPRGFTAKCGLRQREIFTGYSVAETPRCRKCEALSSDPAAERTGSSSQPQTAFEQPHQSKIPTQPQGEGS